MYPTEIQKILCGHLPGLHSVDRCLLLPNGLVGPSGQLFKHVIPPATFYQCDVKVLCVSFHKIWHVTWKTCKELPLKVANHLLGGGDHWYLRGDHGPDYFGCWNVHPWPHYQCDCGSQGHGGHGCVQLRGQQHLRHHRGVSCDSPPLTLRTLFRWHSAEGGLCPSPFHSVTLFQKASRPVADVLSHPRPGPSRRQQ